MRRTAATLLGLLLLAGSVAAAPVRANGVGPFDDVWVARSGSQHWATGSSCALPHAVADGVEDQVELDWAMEHLNDHGTLHLCAGTYRLTQPIGGDPDCVPACYFALPDHVTIQGAGMRRTILDGGATYRRGERTAHGSDILWQFSGEEALVLSDLTVQNATGNDYAAIMPNGTLTVTRVRFYRNASSDAGTNGAAIWGGTTVTINDSQFIENRVDGVGGAISSGDVIITNSRFVGNRAGGEGGAIVANSVDVTGSSFTDNVALDGGGAIASVGSVTVALSSFARNRAVGPGGAIAAGDSTVNTSSFVANVSTGVRADPLVDTCEGGGGALWVSDSLFIADATFTGNRAEAGECENLNTEFGASSVGVGGAIYVQDEFFMIRVDMVRNYAAFLGGAIAAFGEPNIDTIAFTRNRSGGWGGALSLFGPDCRDHGVDSGFHGLVFRANVATEDGGAIVYFDDGAGGAEAAALLAGSTFRVNRDLSPPQNRDLYSTGCPSPP